MLSVDEVAAYCGVSTKTVYRWNTTGTGPPRYRVGRYARYRRDEVDAWLDGRSVGPGSDADVLGLDAATLAKIQAMVATWPVPSPAQLDAIAALKPAS